MELTNLASELRQKIIAFALSTHNLTSSPQVCPCLSQDPFTDCGSIGTTLFLGRRYTTKPRTINLFTCPPIFLTNRLPFSDATQVLHNAQRQIGLRVCSAACATKGLRSCSEQTLDRITSISFERQIPAHFDRNLASQQGYYCLDLRRSCRETFDILREFFIVDDMEYYKTEEVAPEIEGNEEVEWYVRKWDVKRPEGKRYTWEEQLTTWEGSEWRKRRELKYTCVDGRMG